MRVEQMTLFGDNPEYQSFVDKFKRKLTTDDCYTPPLIYETVKDWACERYGIDPSKIVRPFYPGGDYENYDYSNGAVVLDNPPFSIISKIQGFYVDRGIPFFLFAPSLTVIGWSRTAEVTHIFCDAKIEYENGAIVPTAFVTNLGGDVVLETAPDLMDKLNAACKKLRRENVKELPKYIYPDNIVTAAMAQRYAKYRIPFVVRRHECKLVWALDHQRESKKCIYGGALLLSERAAAERAAACVWKLSDREREIIASLGEDNDEP